MLTYVMCPPAHSALLIIPFRYYENNFHVLNFGFYFFLISGFALWADGFKNIAIFDLIFGGILAGATVLYPFGNAAQVVSYAFRAHKKT